MAGMSFLVAPRGGFASSPPSIDGVFDASDAALVPITLFGTTLQVATDATYPPDESMRGTTMVGLDPDVMRAIATTLGLKFHENNVPFNDIIVGVKSGRYQVGTSSFPDTRALEASVNFVDYYRGGEALYAPSSSKITFTKLASLCGLIVGVVRGTVEQSDAEDEVAECPPNASLTLVDFASDAELNQAVIVGQVAGGFVDSQEAGFLAAASHGSLKLVGRAIDVAPFGLATATTGAGVQLARALRAALVTLIENGTYRAILLKWGAGAGALPARLIVLNGARS
jgi:polar amino acid transport system substrate-binding protein